MGALDLTAGMFQVPEFFVFYLVFISFWFIWNLLLNTCGANANPVQLALRFCLVGCNAEKWLSTLALETPEDLSDDHKCPTLCQRLLGCLCPHWLIGIGAPYHIFGGDNVAFAVAVILPYAIGVCFALLMIRRDVVRQLADAPQCPSCRGKMQWSNYAEKEDTEGWTCSNFAHCGSTNATIGNSRWCCRACQINLCSRCKVVDTE